MHGATLESAPSGVGRMLALATGVLLLAIVADVHALRGLAGRQHSRETAASAHERISEAYDGLPLSFEANRGQTDPRVGFLTRGSGYTLFLTPREAVLGLRASAPATGGAKGRPRRGTVLRMGLVGANPHPQLVGQEQLPGKVNYFMGDDPVRWKLGVPTYGKVLYRDVYPGMDLLYHGTQGQLEFDFDLAPRADPRNIVLRMHGAEGLELDGTGDLVLKLAGRELRLGNPFIYQEVDETRQKIAGGYTLRGPDEIGFRLGAYDPSRPLVIDPVLSYSTYLGGGDVDVSTGIAVDSVGSAYVTGVTYSANFPTTAPFQDAVGGDSDAFVTKFSPDGSALLYSTYLGGSDYDAGAGISLDGVGRAYVTGPTFSRNFPTMAPLQGSSGGVADAYVAKLNPAGSALLFSTYLGGRNYDEGAGISVDPSGSSYVTGTTFSANFPTEAPFQGSSGGVADAYVAKLNPAGSALEYSTYLGGRNLDGGSGIAIDGAGGAYVTGWTESATFPTTKGAFQTVFGGSQEVFVAKLKPAGSGLVYSTYLGGDSADYPYAIAVDVLGNAYVTGDTSSSNFPTAIPVQGALPGFSSAFVTKLNTAGSGLVYSTYLGGSNLDGGRGIAVDALGSAYVTGFAESADFPTANAFQPRYGGGEADAFVTKFNPTGAKLDYSSYLGATNNGVYGDYGTAIALDSMSTPNAYVVGVTDSATFPVTTGALQTRYGGGEADVFLAKIATVAPPAASGHKVSGAGSIAVSGSTGNFGFIVQQRAGGAIRGEVQYVNHRTGAKVHSRAITFLAVSGNTAILGGTCTVKGAPCIFSLRVTDNGEPGRNDSFTITYTPPGSMEGGMLRGGNIQIIQK